MAKKKDSRKISTSISIRADWEEILRAKSRKLSYKKGRRISFSEIVEVALRKTYKDLPKEKD